MKATRALVLAASVLAVVPSVIAAPNVVGTWKGRISLDRSKMPPVPAEQKQMVDQVFANIQKMVLTLKLNANKTYTSSAPASAMAPAQNESGTWTLKGNKLTMKPNKPKGPQSGPNTLTVSPDGKMLSFVLPARQGVSGKVVFRR
jgi:hypothetical protein